MNGLRKVAAFVEDIFVEGGRAGTPVRMAGVAAVLTSPWAGKGFVDDLRPAILDVAPRLGEVLVPRLLELLGGGDNIEAYGKAAIVGTSGEIEHASALIHTLRFGNMFRDAVGGKTYLSFTNTRGAPGSQIMIPMHDKQDTGKRSHYLTLNFSIPDAPAPDELIVAIGGATGGRMHPRIGDRYQDINEMASTA
jgi:hypothetical protein